MPNLRPTGPSPRLPNRLLRQARLRLPSPSDPNYAMSRQELADAVNAFVFGATQRVYALNSHYVARLERGVRRWPNADYRAGFRAVLGARTDAELGFRRPHRDGDELIEDHATPSTSVRQHGVPTQLLINAGTAVIVLPTDHPLLLALIDGQQRNR
jgi:hypothetical protein